MDFFELFENTRKTIEKVIIKNCKKLNISFDEKKYLRFLMFFIDKLDDLRKKHILFMTGKLSADNMKIFIVEEYHRNIDYKKFIDILTEHSKFCKGFNEFFEFYGINFKKKEISNKKWFAYTNNIFAEIKNGVIQPL